MNVPHVAIADDVVALLKHCQTLQSEKEGVIRPAPEEYNRDDDPFADRIRQAIGYTRQLQQLKALGVALEQQGKIQVRVGEDYAQQALAYIVAQYQADGGTGR